MWAWIKRLLNTNPPSPSTLEQAFLTQQKLLEQIVKKQQATIDTLVATNDKVITAHYDRPVERVVHPVAADSMPQWALNDQTDVRPDPIAAGLQNLHVESDEEFVSAVN